MKTKLELTWIGKENRARLEPRILIEDPAKSFHASFRTGNNDLFDNRLIFGDNLLALKALERSSQGRSSVYTSTRRSTQARHSSTTTTVSSTHYGSP